MRALIQVEMPKLVKNDVEIFQNLVDDLFPEGRQKKKKQLKKQLENEFLLEANLVCSGLGVSSSEFLLQKSLQMFETLQVRHGLILIGPPGSGKSTILNTTRQTIISISEEQMEEEVGEYQVYRKIQTYRLNPKAVPSSVLYGSFEKDPETDSMVWKDGILALALRSYLETNLDKQEQVTWGLETLIT